MSGAKRSRLILAAAVAAIGLVLWGVAQTQRSMADRIYDESEATHRLVTAMLDQETGLRGYALTRERPYLQPFVDGVREFNVAAEDVRAIVDDDRRADVERMIALATRWRALADRQIARLGQDPARARRPALAAESKRLFDAFRRTGAAVERELTRDHDARIARAELIAVAVIAAVGALALSLGLYWIERLRRRDRAARERERRYRDSQSEFAEAMQVMRDESEAQRLLERHLERTIEGAEVTILGRDGRDRLYAAIGGDGPLAAALVDAPLDSCLALRLGHSHEQGDGDAPLLACELCGKTAPEVLCTPALVGGEAIGSVLVRAARPLADDERARVEDSVAQASPVLANLRNLALAEARAATDVLTGLPNSRSCRETVERMVAHAARAMEPLSAVMFDIDHFKQVNDSVGHGVGDDVLAAVGEVVRATLRESDFGGRYGGEEFLVLLPGADRIGARELAEKLRRAIAALEFPVPGLAVTASFGTATYPVDALDAAGLVQAADRALYLAKSRGRDRVEPAHDVGRPGEEVTRSPLSP